MARKTTEALVNSPRGPVVPRPRLVKRVGRVALETDLLPWVIRDFQLPCSLPGFQQRQSLHPDVDFFVSVVPLDIGWTSTPVIEDLRRIVVPRTDRGRTFPMDLVAGKAWNGRQIRLSRHLQLPGTLRTHRRHQVFNRTAEEHAMATQTIGIELFARIVFGIQEYGCIRRRMPSRDPTRILRPVTAPAIVRQLQNLSLVKRDLSGPGSREVMDKHHPFFLQAVESAAQSRSVTFLAGKIPMAAPRPHNGGFLYFMAALTA